MADFMIISGKDSVLPANWSTKVRGIFVPAHQGGDNFPSTFTPSAGRCGKGSVQLRGLLEQDR